MIRISKFFSQSENQSCISRFFLLTLIQSLERIGSKRLRRTKGVIRLPTLGSYSIHSESAHELDLLIKNHTRNFSLNRSIKRISLPLNNQTADYNKI